ncbi:MAG: hypothetical protein U1E73_06290 [Planctomycetota bacterium]
MNHVTKTLATFALFAVPAFAQNEERPLETPSVECNRVFDEARRLPAPTPSSVYEYGRRVVNQGARCVQSGFNSTRGAGRGE